MPIFVLLKTLIVKYPVWKETFALSPVAWVIAVRI